MHLAHRFLRGLSQAASRPALVVGSEVLTYQELHSLAMRWAGGVLRTVGRRPIGVVCGRSVLGYVGVLAGVYAGVPVVPLLADHPVGRTRQMLASAGVAGVIVDAAGAQLDLGLPVVSPSAPVAPCEVGSSDIAYILFTSGSTGRPKGVRLSYGNLAHYFSLTDSWYGFSCADVFSQAAGLNWDSAVSDLWCAWGAGACLVSVPAVAYRDLPGFVGAHGVSVWFSAPSVISLVRRTGRLGPGSLRGLRWSFFGGEGLTHEDAASWQAAAPESAVVNVYGPTEATITTHRHTWSAASGGINGIVPLGRLHPGLAERIVGGELWISGPQVSPGYVDADDGVFRDGWYRTGDRVVSSAEGLLYLGRLDGQVQVGGYRVELAEVDHALRGVSGVDSAATVGAPLGSSTALVAFYTGEAVSPLVLRRELGGVLPGYMIPRYFRHVTSLPVNANRKVDRLVLAARAREVVS
ncbi:AMP-binding protein [Actinocrispum sp. NPDC049592]|uniref:AMP-binding protein n=1 Tax=Actinocrispum sp. NPDC049592 TaxID=3154835 RepID=UPI00341B0074